MRLPRLAALLLALPLACATPPSASRPAPPPASRAEAPAERVVQIQLEAYNRRDLEAFLATYAADAKIYDHPDRLRLSGRGQLRERYGGLFASTPRLHAAVTARMVQGDFVLEHEHVTGLPGGEEIRAVAIYEVRNDQIQNVWFIR